MTRPIPRPTSTRPDPDDKPAIPAGFFMKNAPAQSRSVSVPPSAGATPFCKYSLTIYG